MVCTPLTTTVSPAAWAAGAKPGRKYVLAPLAPLIKYWSTPKRAARLLAGALTSQSHQSGAYYDENGKPMLGSAQVRDPAFTDQVVAETRALLAQIPSKTR
ncbi:hypothetical protein [Streptomyces sp. NPDC059262]|uniref:hypothetical protein n=1 Tax=Streptomyces sp. NPDC059262 TaxID=3346797 RepID=UPI0036BF2263